MSELYYCDAHANMENCLFIGLLAKLSAMKWKPVCIKGKCKHYVCKYETPEQFNKRTGDKWPDWAPVWVFVGGQISKWELHTFIEAKHCEAYYGDEHCHAEAIICAIGKNKPPEDWLPK
jgi:hypothetical protein